MGLSNNLGKLSNMITSTGSAVGIAQPSPAYTLDVSGTLRNTTSAYFATTSGSVGIGTTSPAYPLDVKVATNRHWAISASSTGFASFRAGDDGYNNFNRGEIDALPLLLNSQSGGNVGIGTSSTGFNPAGLPLVVGSGSGNTGLTIFSGTSSSGSIHFADTETTGGGSFSGYINYDHSGNSMQFGTNSTERMRITSGGDVGIGNVNSSAYRLLVAAKDNSSSNYALVVTNSSLSTLLYIRNDGYAWISQTAWAYGSDRRLKENINYIETGLEKILALKPAKFDYIDGSKDNIGWIAQDVQEIIPEAVLVNTNDERGYLSLKSDFIIPYLVKAIQELNEKLIRNNIN